jgi:CheY-like chemotaxis protein
MFPLALDHKVVPSAIECDLILLADGDPEHVALARRNFKKYCFVNPLFVVSDGTEVISYLLGEGQFSNRDEYPAPSLLLLDLKLPRMHGLDVIRWVRAHPDFKTLPIAVLTSPGDWGDVNRAYAIGANSFLVKPLDFVDFVHMTGVLKNYWLWLNKPPRLPVRSWQRFD